MARTRFLTPAPVGERSRSELLLDLEQIQSELQKASDRFEFVRVEELRQDILQIRKQLTKLE